MKDSYQSPECLASGRYNLINNFIAGAPEHNRRVVPVAADEVCDIPLRPFIEIYPVSVIRSLRLGFFPLVVDFVHHQKT